MNGLDEVDELDMVCGRDQPAELTMVKGMNTVKGNEHDEWRSAW